LPSFGRLPLPYESRPLDRVAVVEYQHAAEGVLADLPLDRLGLHGSECRRNTQGQHDGHHETAHGDFLRAMARA